ncbi:hypothetical protein L484_013633 [Morus notabilis]|uniref:Uncharacterized protein n=1 Tax=Morus notabilis TaxID=981085 RepID=W9QX60_9ROSA|nr:hypothetical protein L484_013633 [Morus notabilis]
MSRVAEFPVMARAHLAVLSAHLASASLEPTKLFGSAALEPNCVSAQTFVPPLPNLKGSLTVVDERTGRSYQVQASDEGTVKATDLKKITTGRNEKVPDEMKIVFCVDNRMIENENLCIWGLEYNESCEFLEVSNPHSLAKNRDGRNSEYGVASGCISNITTGLIRNASTDCDLNVGIGFTSGVHNRDNFRGRAAHCIKILIKTDLHDHTGISSTKNVVYEEILLLAKSHLLGTDDLLFLESTRELPTVSSTNDVEEDKVFKDLVSSDTSRRPVHVIFAQCATSKVPIVTDIRLKAKHIKIVSIIGGRLMGSTIAIAVLLSNVSVLLKEVNSKYLLKRRKI